MNYTKNYKDSEGKILSTLKTIKNYFSWADIRFIIIKTRIEEKSLDSGDLDILVDNFVKAVHILKKYGFIVSKAKSHKSDCVRRDLFKIELHGEISWEGAKMLDVDKIFNRARKTTVSNIDFLLPSIEDDIMITCAHWIFQRSYISFSDFLHITKLLRKHRERCDWNYLLEIPKKYGWSLALRTSLHIVDKMNCKFHDKKNGIEFPHMLPLMLIISNRVIKFLLDLKKINNLHELFSILLQFIFGLSLCTYHDFQYHIGKYP